MDYKWNDYKVLLVEDDETSLIFLQEVLDITGIKIVSAKDGREAIDIVKNNPDIELVLMDIQLPVMNGFEATREIKKINPDLTVIAQTAYAMEEDRRKCLAAGCSDVLTKPIEEKQLFNTMKKYLEK
ncbi:MAG: response regulator [bacterium]